MNSSRCLVGFLKSLCSIFLLLVIPPLYAHHFKGLPHFNYFENYPQIPQDEFLGQSGDYECSLVIYDFQGIDKREAQMPDKVCFYLVLFNLRINGVYAGPLLVEIMDGETTIYSEKMSSAVEENIYTLQRNLGDAGDYSLRLTLEDKDRTVIDVPFILSSQRIAWGLWVSLVMITCVVVVIIGSRRARVRLDRQQNAQSKQRNQVNPAPMTEGE